MKIFSLWQPWATAMERGWKKIETRSWQTPYRGDMAIQAALKRLPAQVIDQTYRNALLDPPTEPHPHGVILCVVELYDIQPTEILRPRLEKADRLEAAHELCFGNYADKRFGWMTRNLRLLSRHVHVRGAQGLRDLDPEIEAELRSVMLQPGGTP